jgi:hypothetical protein
VLDKYSTDVEEMFLILFARRADLLEITGNSIAGE